MQSQARSYTPYLWAAALFAIAYLCAFALLTSDWEPFTTPPSFVQFQKERQREAAQYAEERKAEEREAAQR